jgi:hypothetical protein
LELWVACRWCPSSKIQIVSPLTKESISKWNKGGGNWGTVFGATLNQIEKIEGTTTTSLSRCSACGKAKSKYQKLRKCSGCHAVQYCNPECQKKHWKIGGHKKECKKLKQQQHTNTNI